MSKNTVHRTTTFQISHALHVQLKMMCTLTEKSMGEFIRLAIVDKIKDVKVAKQDDN
jgi:hypothetical protein